MRLLIFLLSLPYVSVAIVFAAGCTLFWPQMLTTFLSRHRTLPTQYKNVTRGCTLSLVCALTTYPHPLN